MSVRDNFVKDIVDLMGKESSFDFEGRIGALTGILLKYKDELPGDEVDDIVGERKANIEKQRALDKALGSLKERKTERPADVGLDIRNILGD